jgi:hypothetical protein
VLEDKNYAIRDRRIEAITRWIAENDPDIITIQEGWNYRHYSSIVAAVAERIGYDYAYRLGMGAPLLMYDSNGILAKKKFHLGQERDVRLPHGAPWMGDGKKWVLVFGSISWAVGARLTLEDGTPLYVYTSHLIGKSQGHRDDQLLAMDRTIRKHVAYNHEDWEQAHVLLTGDLNSGPETRGIRELVQNGYRNTFADAHPGVDICTNCGDPSTPEFNPMTISPGEFPVQDKLTGNEWLDHILAHGPDMLTLASTLTFTQPLGGMWMSDHSGLLSTILVGGSVPSSPVPNPISDRTHAKALTQVVHVTEDLLNCRGVHCELAFLDPITAERGITFINESRHSFRVRARPAVQGAGWVWPRQHADIGPGRATAYFFEPGFDYEYGVSDSLNRRVHGALRVGAEWLQ